MNRTTDLLNRAHAVGDELHTDVEVRQVVEGGESIGDMPAFDTVHASDQDIDAGKCANGLGRLGDVHLKRFRRPSRTPLRPRARARTWTLCIPASASAAVALGMRGEILNAKPVRIDQHEASDAEPSKHLDYGGAGA